MKFFTRKRLIWGAVIVLVIMVGVSRFRSKQGASGTIQTDTAKKTDLSQTVLTTGQVVSSVDLNLSFQASGVVKAVYVKEGDKVKAGQTLAILDQRTALASLTSAQGALAQAKANYDRVLAGASSEQIAVSQRAVDVAETTLDNANSNLKVVTSQQATLVTNAYNSMLNAGLVATPGTTNISVTSPTISGTYTGAATGDYRISIYETQSGMRFTYSGIESGDGEISTVGPRQLGTKGLYLQFPVGSSPRASDYWTISIPNQNSSAYLTAYNAYQAALQTQSAALAAAQAQVATAQTAVGQALANLEVQQAEARPADLDAAKAQILSAQGQVAAASVTLSNTVIKAPSDGTITQVDIKVGELATALKEMMILQDINSLHAEANVSEANVAALAVGQSVDYTFDALGPDKHFAGTVATINPASTVISGVVNYKVTANLDNIPEIKSGMTANMTILVAQKAGAIAVPSSAIINKDAKQYVRVVDDTKKKTYHEVEVKTGLQADGGLVEIVSGISEGQEVVTYIKQ